MQANTRTLTGLLLLCSTSQREKARDLEIERDKVMTVVQKLDREQPHQSGISRSAAFNEYFLKINSELKLKEYWVNRHYYRGAVMSELQSKFSSDNISDTNSISDTSSIYSIVSWVG